MLLEMMVFTVCLQDLHTACGSAVGAYYHSNQQLQESVRLLERRAQNAIRGNEWIVYAFTPIYSAALGRTSSFMIRHNLVFELNIREQTIFLRWIY